MSILAVSFFETNGFSIAIACALIGLAFAVYLIKTIVSSPAGNDKMKQIAAAIEEGAKAYLGRQLRSVTMIAGVLVVLLAIFKDLPTAAGFVLGAACSLAAGFIGMRIAVVANVRTAQGATISRQHALRAAFNGGAVTGLLVVGLALLSVAGFWMVMSRINPDKAVASLVGVALGASLISVFARLGGGIYTKAADVGADLVGKVESNLDEDDPRNPATIADNVGDNVGDCAGMAADVFETYAVSLIGAVLVGALTVGLGAPVVYPFVLGGLSIIASIIGILYVNYTSAKPANALMGGVLLAALISAAAFWPVTTSLFPNGLTVTDVLTGGTATYSALGIYMASVIGLLMTGAAVLITNYYTSTAYAPVRKIADASVTGHATNIIAGLAVGQHATALPVFCIAASIWGSFAAAGLYGIAVAVMAMLAMAGIIISLDAFGPITDNAGGIATMSELPKEVRVITDDLDAVGNTMKAVTKGYAIASAGLAAVVLFGSYFVDLKHHLEVVRQLPVEEVTKLLSFSLKDPKVIIGLFIGGLLPYLFSAFSMNAVGRAAGAVVTEVRRQLALHPGILKGTDTPDYGTCVDIVTKAALKEMIVPALLPVLAVVLVAAIKPLGAVVLGGMLVGSIVTGLFMGISMTSSGGAWDNAKKFIEEGHHGGKGSEAHKASVTGDTVGDPYKDTSGPAINPMIKVVNIVAILVIPIFSRQNRYEEMNPFQLLAGSGISVLLVGGQALHAYRYTRQTMDFDFMVAETNYSPLREYLEGRGYAEQGQMGQFGRFRPGPQQEPVLDIGMVDEATFDKLWAASEEHEWDDVRLRVPAFLHLIALKLHASKNVNRGERDIADVWELLRLNPHDTLNPNSRRFASDTDPQEYTSGSKEFVPMKTLKPDLDLNLPVGISDLPPPWPPTDVAIEWWMNRPAFLDNPVASEERLASPWREHFDEPFVM